jgi:PhzF family phenazine biosynthesis protein
MAPAEGRDARSFEPVSEHAVTGRSGPPVPIHVVDAFTDEPFRGNPAGVCLLDEPAPADWMQAVAAEMRHAETAFLVPGDGAWGLRWFTPVLEVDLCGHATVASAHVLWTLGRAPLDRAIAFDTRSGRLGARRDGAWIVLDLPVDRPAPAEVPPTLVGALGVEPERVATILRARFDWLVEVDAAATVASLAPDLVALRAIPSRGVIVTAPGDAPGVDFVSRFFAPAAGVDEDPVTGSAHCALAPHWAPRLGRPDLVGRQLSPRGGTVRVRLGDDRVEVGGRAVTVLTGELRA